MRMKFDEPITEPLTIRVTWLDVEVLRKDFGVGETPEISYDAPPNTTGVAQIYIIKDGEEKPSGCATYWAPDFNGAKTLVKEAERLVREKKSWQARTKLKKAVKIFEKLAPDSNDLAEAYEELWSVCFHIKGRSANKARRRQETLAWYEKQIAVYDRNGDNEKLAGNLLNIGSLYYRYGDSKTALERAQRALEICRSRDDSKFSRQIIAWYHCATYLNETGRETEAEKLIEEGLARFPGDPLRAYLLNLLSKILEKRPGELARSKALRKEAEEILPPNSCSL